MTTRTLRAARVAPRALRAALLAASLCAAATPAAPARAADPIKKANPADAALAEALFKEARDLMRSKNYAAACPKFAESYRLDPGLGALLNLAACHEAQGKIATAWGEYRDADAQALRTNDKSRQKFAAEHASALEPRLPKLVLTMREPPANLEVSRDGTALGTASLGTPLPIDPGEHRIEATAPGFLPWSTKVQAKEGRRVEVEIPALEAAPEEPAKVDTGGPNGPDRATPPPNEGWSGRTVAGVLVGGAGIAGLAVGGVFVALTASKKSEADEPNNCDAQKKCQEDGITAIESAKTFAWGANIALGAGAALLVAGGVLLLTGGESDPAPATEPAVSVLPFVGPEGGGIGARIRF